MTTFFSANCNKSDADVISKFLNHIGMEAFNTRAFKTLSPDGSPHYEVNLQSVYY